MVIGINLCSARLASFSVSEQNCKILELFTYTKNNYLIQYVQLLQVILLIIIKITFKAMREL